MNENLKAFCQYSNESMFDHGIEALRLFLPTSGGYINYNIVHSVMQKSKCDTWRLSVVYYCNGDFERVKPLTRPGAEWEMALKISERPDFIGGYAHGDEFFQKVELIIDGEHREISSLSDMTPFDELIFDVSSIGYDPIDSATEALLHRKKIIVNSDKIKVEQKVEWLNDYMLGNSYMAMLPPFKEVTDSYYTNTDPAPKPIGNKVSISETGSFDTLCLCGKTGFTFSLKLEKYLNDGNNTFLISDNGGVPYNKMYFYLNHGGYVKRGEIWETETVYAINKEEV